MNFNTHTVCILMAIYNGERYIKEQIDSILTQSYSNWILYIRDDGSCDNTMSIIKKYIQKYPEQIFLLEDSLSSQNVKENFNILLQSVPKFDYYMFADQDDVWEKNKISVLLDRILKAGSQKITNPLLVYCDLKVVDSNLNTIHSSFMEYSNLILKDENQFQQLLLFNVAPGCSMMFNHALREKISRIPKECHMHDWWVILVANILGEIIFVPKPLVLYRQHEHNVLGASNATPKNYWKCYKKWFNLTHLLYLINFYRKYKNSLLTQSVKVLEYFGNDLSIQKKQTILIYIKMLQRHFSLLTVVKAFQLHFTFPKSSTTFKFWII